MNLSSLFPNIGQETPPVSAAPINGPGANPGCGSSWWIWILIIIAIIYFCRFRFLGCYGYRGYERYGYTPCYGRSPFLGPW